MWVLLLGVFETENNGEVQQAQRLIAARLVDNLHRYNSHATSPIILHCVTIILVDVRTMVSPNDCELIT